KLYDMLPGDAGDTCEGRTPATNATVRTVFVIGPDKKIKLMLSYPMTTGRNFDEILRVVDSIQLTAKHKVATPVNWKQGEDVIITAAVSNEEAAEKFPGYKTIKPYLRVTAQPKECVARASGRAGRRPAPHWVIESWFDRETSMASFIQNQFEQNFITTNVDYVFNWARKSPLWPLTFGLACCAIEMIASSTSRFDIARFGAEVFRPSPRQSDLMIVAGTVTLKMAPVLKRI